MIADDMQAVLPLLFPAVGGLLAVVVIAASILWGFKAGDDPLPNIATVTVLAFLAVGMVAVPMSLSSSGGDKKSYIAQQAVEEEYGIEIRGAEFQKAIERDLADTITFTLTYSKDGQLFSIPITLLAGESGDKLTVDLLMGSDGDQSELIPFNPEEAKKLASALGEA